MTIKQLYNQRFAWMHEHVYYKMSYFEDFDYTVLNNIIHYKKRGRGKNPKINEVWIMVDTETSKKPNSLHNHVVAWTISIRAFDMNIVTLWGRKPSEVVNTMYKIHSSMRGEETVFYIHNMGYDWVFLRKFMFKDWGIPAKQLNVKAHYPINIRFNNGIVLKDSLILAQRSLEKWAKDMNVTPKAVGKWDYNKLRNQNEEFTAEELEYIEHDTIAGVEALNALSNQLNKTVGTMPYTATGIPREELRARGKQNRARDSYVRMVPNYNQYDKLTKVFHGGYTHANRFISGQVIKEGGSCYDFSSSYPFVMCSERMPMSKFNPIDDKPIEYILKYRDEYAFMFKLILVDVELKPNIAMPALQVSKSDLINPVIDNGRLIKAKYCSIYTNEIDLSVIALHYNYSYAICKEVEYARKDYLPRFFTDYVYELYQSKTTLKGGDPVAYSLAKAKLNSL